MICILNLVVIILFYEFVYYYSLSYSPAMSQRFLCAIAVSEVNGLLQPYRHLPNFTEQEICRHGLYFRPRICALFGLLQCVISRVSGPAVRLQRHFWVSEPQTMETHFFQGLFCNITIHISTLFQCLGQKSK